MEWLKKTYPEVQWLLSSAIIADFNDDHIQDYAAIGYQHDKVILAIFTSPFKTSTQPAIFTFGISPNIQDGICERPAVLEAESLSCSTEDFALPGCKPSKKSKGLLLYGGDCDAIHLYWNHDRHRMEWWRL